ncbi:uncharacterized protein LOC144246307 isoform X1 [Lonchura striata]
MTQNQKYFETERITCRGTKLKTKELKIGHLYRGNYKVWFFRAWALPEKLSAMGVLLRFQVPSKEASHEGFSIKLFPQGHEVFRRKWSISGSVSLKRDGSYYTRICHVQFCLLGTVC